MGLHVKLLQNRYQEIVRGAVNWRALGALVLNKYRIVVRRIFIWLWSVELVCGCRLDSLHGNYIVEGLG